MSPLYCSTTGAGVNSAFSLARQLQVAGAEAIELSGGKFSPNQRNDIIQLEREVKDLVIHNYFPVPKVSFVMNLSSMDKDVLDKSIKHAKNAIDIASELKSKVFGVHSGFLVDPDPSELGSLFKSTRIIKRDIGLNIFRNSVCLLSDYAESAGVKLLLENNVSNKINFDYHGKDIFLLSNPCEIIDFFKTVPSKVGLLLDVGHLKVTGSTLKFDVIKGLEELVHLTAGYHFSENDGLNDDHLEFDIKTWPYKYFIRKDLEYYTLEFKNYQFSELRNQLNNFKDWLAN
jgi:sugar phosphate isomerase/epimerase